MLMRLPAPRIATRIRDTLRGGITQVRRITRAGGVERLGAEFASVGVPLAVARSEARQLIRDSWRADSAASSYARQWLAKTGDATHREAAAATSYALERTAITEASDAYNSGRLAYLDEVVGVDLLRVWDSAFDKNTCDLCSSADGTTVGINESFPLGEPGSVHPRCMCSWHIVETRGSRKVAPLPPEFEPPKLTVPATPALAAEGYSAEQRTDRAARAYERMVASEVMPEALRARRMTSGLEHLQSGINESELGFLRSGYRPAINPYDGVPPSRVNGIATGRLIPPGSRMPLPPISIGIEDGQFHLIDGRHRLEAAQLSGATEMRAKIRQYDSDGNTVWVGDRIIPVPRLDPTNPHERN